MTLQMVELKMDAAIAPLIAFAQTTSLPLPQQKSSLHIVSVCVHFSLAAIHRNAEGSCKGW